MIRISLAVAVVATCLLPSAVQSQAGGDTLTIEIENTVPPGTPVCVPITVPDKHGKVTEVGITGKGGSKPFQGQAQVTAPGIMTEHIKATAGGVRRELHFRTPELADKTLTIVVNFAGTSPSATAFTWQDKTGEYADLSFKGTPVMRYMYKAYDNSSPEQRDKTYKVFHHLYDPAGKRFVTNGGETNDKLPKNPKDLLWPHHRGLMYAFNKINYDSAPECDTWHAKPGETHQSHMGFLGSEGGNELGRHRVAVNWYGVKNDVFANEEREMTVFKMKDGILVEFASRLKSPKGIVKLAGDPQHAGFQFRVHNDLHEGMLDNQTYYVSPEGKSGLGKKGERNWDPKTGKGPIDIGWDSMHFILDGKRYTAVYMDHPKNPHPSRWSERDYGRFGCYFETTFSETQPLEVNYRLWLQEGEMTPAAAAELARQFVSPPKVTVR
jgi:hypothetical protein